MHFRPTPAFQAVAGFGLAEPLRGCPRPSFRFAEPSFRPTPAFRAVAGFELAVPFRGVLSPRGFAPSLGLTSFLHRISVLPSVAARFPVLFYFTMKKRPPQRATPSSTPAGRSRPPSAGPPDWGFPPARRSSPSAAPPARRLPRSDRRCPGGSRRIGRWRRSGCPPATPASGPAGR